jgi:MFS family permease
MQIAVPDEVRGRTGAARSALVSVANLISMAAAGILADNIGTRNVFVLGGAMVMLAGLSAAIIFRGVSISVPETNLSPAQD